MIVRTFIAALVMGASTAHAEVARLRCNETVASMASTLDIDLAAGSVYTVYDNGRAAQTSQADVTDRFISWRVRIWDVRKLIATATPPFAWTARLA